MTANKTSQATPVRALLFFLSPVPGAPEFFREARYFERITVSQSSMKTMKTTALFVISMLFAFSGYTAQPVAEWSGQGTREETLTSTNGIILEGSNKLISPNTFRPPVEITIVAKTDSSNLRISYAADQVIFNWDTEADQLRVDGGPANGQQIKGVGQIPKDKFVTIRWLVTPRHQAIYVDDELRFEHCGDYADIRRRVSIFPSGGSVVTVKSVTVKQQ
jgi:hypothetical protein